MKLLALLATVTALATPAGYVQSQQREDGGFGDPQLTAWATLGLAATGVDTGRAAEYLAAHEPKETTDVALAAMDLERHRQLVGHVLADHLLVVVDRRAEDREPVVEAADLVV